MLNTPIQIAEKTTTPTRFDPDIRYVCVIPSISAEPRRCVKEVARRRGLARCSKVLTNLLDATGCQTPSSLRMSRGDQPGARQRGGRALLPGQARAGLLREASTGRASSSRPAAGRTILRSRWAWVSHRSYAHRGRDLRHAGAHMRTAVSLRSDSTSSLQAGGRLFEPRTAYTRGAAHAKRSYNRREMDLPNPSRPGRIKRLVALLRGRREPKWVDWTGEEPPDIGVREPRRPRPGSGSGSVVIDPPQ